MDRTRRAQTALLCVLLSMLAGAIAATPGMGARAHVAIACAKSTSFSEGNIGNHPSCHHPVVHRGACANSRLRPTRFDIRKIRKATLCLVNHARLAHGELPLRPNPALERAAQGHTESMAFGDYFEHIGPAGQTPSARMRAAGYLYSRQITFQVGENIGMGTLSDATPLAIFRAWMDSPGHRANILDGHFRDTAIGVPPHPPAEFAHGRHGAVYTQDFGVIVHARIAR